MVEMKVGDIDEHGCYLKAMYMNEKRKN